VLVKKSLAFLAAAALGLGLAAVLLLIPATATAVLPDPDKLPRGNTATAVPPDPTALPKGDAPAVTWQSGTTVHTASGKTVHLPLGKAGAGYEVLGKRRGAWIVAVQGYNHAKVLAVKGAKVRTVWKHVYNGVPGEAAYYTLAERGSLVAEWGDKPTSYNDSDTVVAVFDLTGKVVARRRWSDVPVNLLDFVGNTMLIRRTTENVQTWTVPGTPVSAGPDAAYGDLDGDLLFVELPGDFSGPTSLSAPGVPAWSSNLFIPERLSPDGQYVAGRNYTGRTSLSVRKVVDGTELPIPRFRFRFGSAMTWEPDGSLLVEVPTGSGHTLVRCTMTGACTRTTAIVKDGHLGFPA
jgi:hypothetical protein